MKSSTYQTETRAVCCPLKGYRGERVFAVIRAGDIMQYVFANGQTLTSGPKLRQATFPVETPLPDLLEQGKRALRALRPKTGNLYVTVSP